MNPITSVIPEHRARSERPAGAAAIIASAGGIPALIALLQSLQSAFPLPIVVVQHLPRFESRLDAVLSRHSALHVSWAAEGARPQAGGVYLAPPRMRLAVTAAGFALSPLSQSASSWLGCGDHLIESLVALYGSRTIGVVLSGALPAGIAGLRTISACGGYIMAQDRSSSGWFDMPAAAIDFGKADIVLPPQRLAMALNIIAGSWREEATP